MEKQENKAVKFLVSTLSFIMIWWGMIWFLISVVNYFTTSPNGAPQQIIVENFLNQSLLSLIVIALGVLVDKK